VHLTFTLRHDGRIADDRIDKKVECTVTAATSSRPSRSLSAARPESTSIAAMAAKQANFEDAASDRAEFAQRGNKFALPSGRQLCSLWLRDLSLIISAPAPWSAREGALPRH
jgi:hypothetical protein